MKSKKWFFDLTVYKKTIARFWPLWAAYFVIWLIFLPLQGLMYLRMDANDLNGFGGSYMESFARYTVASRAGNETILMLAMLFGVLGAMAVFSHLYNARSVPCPSGGRGCSSAITWRGCPSPSCPTWPSSC